MLIKFCYLYQKYKLNIKGILHIGAHRCQEKVDYNNCGVTDDKIIWIEGDQKVFDQMKDKILHLYNYIIADKDNESREFMITNNEESSSILNLKEHLKEHPHVKEVDRVMVKTKTIDTFYRENGLDAGDYNFVNIDIQGAELLALKGMKEALGSIDYLYLEVNIKELYEDCALLEDIDAYLKEYGFMRVEIKLTQFGWGDAFYMK